MADIVPAWMWRDPYEVIEGLLVLSDRRAMRPIIAVPMSAPASTPRDRYYTQARKLHVKQLMKGIL